MDIPTTVRSLLDAAGFDPSPQEFAELQQEYVVVKQMVEMLYRVEAARYDSPGLIFDPNPEFAEWDVVAAP